MTSSSMEFYRKGDFGKIAINWRGRDNGGNEIFHSSYEALKTVKKLMIVAESSPNSAATCFRFILLVIREAQKLGIRTEVVIPDIELLDAAETTGFSTFFRVFLTEAEALDQLDIKDFYPLTLIKIDSNEPDPIAA